MTDGKTRAEDKIDVKLHQPPEKMSTPLLSLLLSTTTNVGVVAQSLEMPLPVHVELTVGGATVSASAEVAAAPGGSRMSFAFDKDFLDANDEMRAILAECHQILTDAGIDRKTGKEDSLPARIRALVEEVDRLESSAEDAWEHMAGEDA